MNRIILVALVAIAAVMAAPTAVAASKTFNIETTYVATGWVFREVGGSANNPTLNVDPGDSVTINLTNKDPASNVGPHNIVVKNGNTAVSGAKIPATGYLQTVNASATGTFTVPSTAGAKLTYICEVHETSMKGTMQVSGSAGSGDKGTPGFEMALVALAGVGAALVVRRRLA